ncbi:MAG: FAD-dependent oxidoreductase [Propionibacteriaceae bacterium]
MSTTFLSTSIAEQLTAAGASRVITPDQPDYATELATFNLATRHTPAVVVAATSTEDVAVAVRVANQLDLGFTVIGQGHGVLDPAVGGIAVTTRGLAGVQVDEAGRTATVRAGTVWSAVIDAATPLGLAPLCGSAPHVGVMGYLLGGGLGPVARTYGYAADHVQSFRVVTPDGRLVTADQDHEPDLFWALRGGKGGLGVVVEATIYLFPLASVYGGGIYFAAADARAVLRAFSEWTAQVPENVTSSVALLRLPPLPELPPPLRGQFVVHVRVAIVGDREEAEALLAPIRSVATPLIDAVGDLPYAAIGSIHNDPVNPMPVAEGGVTLRAFGSDTADALLAAAGPDVDVPLVAVEIRHLGGALSRQPTVPNAVGGRDAAYGLHVVGAPVPELLETVIPQVIRGIFAALGPWRTGGALVNFVGKANDPDSLRNAWPAEIAERLDQVRASYDQQGRFPYGNHRATDH